MTDRWFVLTAHILPGDPRRDLLGEGLIAFGGSSVLEDESSLTTYLPVPSGEPATYLGQAETFLRNWIGTACPTLSWRWQAGEDWASEWRKGLQPRKVSPRIVVRPSWTTWEAAPGEVVVVIDPQMAFGTGEHATTRGCLQLLDSHFLADSRVLDVGSGSAVLAIAAAMLGAHSVVAVEYDPDATLNAAENVANNEVSGRIELIEQIADADLIVRLGQFDIILANILSGVIRPLLPAFRHALARDGRLIVSGILREERDQMVADAGAAGLVLLDEVAEEEWWSGALGKN